MFSAASWSLDRFEAPRQICYKVVSPEPRAMLILTNQKLAVLLLEAYQTLLRIICGGFIASWGKRSARYQA